jgi:hypothetical protein
VEIGRMRFDTYIGMGYSNVISLFVIVSTAATLNANGIYRHPNLPPGGRSRGLSLSPCSPRESSASAFSRLRRLRARRGVSAGPPTLWAMGWLCTVRMAAVVGIMFATW